MLINNLRASWIGRSYHKFLQTKRMDSGEVTVPNYRCQRNEEMFKNMKISLLLFCEATLRCKVRVGLILMFFLISSVQANIPVVINEFMTSNRNTISDPQDQYDDWIELYNNGSNPINIGGIYLTDDMNVPTKWQIPSSAIIQAGGYLLIWADGDIGDTGLHANFKLDADGEEICLFDSDGTTLIDSVTFSAQTTDISYGRYPDASDEWRFFSPPSPRQENEGGFPGIVADTKFSMDRGFYDIPFYVIITTETVGATIRYTTDGSTPTETYGQIYTGPIQISTTTCLRAMAYKSGWMPTNADTHTYIFLDDVARQPADPPGWPSNWGHEHRLKVFYITGEIPSDYEMDSRVVNNTLPGYSVRDALLDIPTVSIAMLLEDFITDNEENGIYSNAYDRWERACSVEYILPDGGDGFQENCKIEVHGGASRYPQRMQKHSLRLTFTSQYGPAKLRYPLFPGSDVDEFNQLILRASFTDSWGLVSWDPSRYRPNDSQYIRDVWMKESLGDMGQPSSRGTFVHLYVNGLYFGIHNLTERLADDFFADHLGGEPEDWEINEDFSSPGARWNAMMRIDPSTITGYEQIQEYLDVENFADYMLLHFYADSEDWPHHNGYAAVNAISGDGKFRFFVWDQEIVLDNHGRAASRIDNSNGAGSVFQKMRTSDEFRLLFADRVYKHCFNNGALSVTASQDRYLTIANWIDKAIVAESARWGDTQMSTPYGNSIQQPSPLNDINHYNYPPAPNGPDYYFTREDSWAVERDNIINNYIPAIHDTTNSYAILNVLRSKNLYPYIDPPVFQINRNNQHDGYVLASDLLSLTTSTGTILYTLDGTDPRLPGTSQQNAGTSTVLAAENADKRVLVPTGPVNEEWKGGGIFNDRDWIPGTGGIGYDTGSEYRQLIDIDLYDQMYQDQTSCYIRIPFDVTTDPEQYSIMTLKICYDDGFVAYVNGTEVARRNFAGTPAWNSNADTTHDDSAAVNFEYINISSYLDILVSGYNVLAIHGLNRSSTSTDFLISAELIADKTTSPSEAGISPRALQYIEAITLTESTCVKARVLDGSTWSALNEATYAVGPVAESLRITEIMYHPQSQNEPNDPNEEFIELTNIGAETINLNLVKFTNGIDFTFPSLELAPGEYIVVVQDKAAFEARYGTEVTIAGQYAGKLANDGERIRLEDAVGQTILNFSYKDGWYDGTDGQGYSLVIIDPLNTDPDSWDDKDSWRAGTNIGGSPGEDDSA